MTQIGFGRITPDQFHVEYGNFTVIKHRHYSTLELNKNKVVNREGKIYCSFCKISRHFPYPMKRKPILVTSSALHGWRANFVAMGEYDGDDLHVDTIAIPGGTITSLMRAFLAELGPYRGPVDVILVAGLNDVIRGC